MLISILLFLCELDFGILVFDFFDPEKRFSFWERTIAALFAGFLLSNFVIFLIAILLKSLSAGIVTFLFIFFIIAIIRFKVFENEVIKLKKIILEKKWLPFRDFWIIFIVFIIFFYLLFILSIFFKNQSGSFSAPLIGWHDTTFHVTMIERFANANPFNLDNPVMAGAKLAYPFMINFISGIFRKLGADVIFAYRLPLIFCGIASILLAFIYSLKILKSRTFALIAILFIFWGNGLGVFKLFSDFKLSFAENGLASVNAFFKNPPHEYTNLNNSLVNKNPDQESNIVWIAPAIIFFSHQRSFSLGLPIFILVLLGLFYYKNTKFFWRFSFFAAALPLSHMHSFFALFILLAVLFFYNLKNWRSWLNFAFVAGILAIPQILYLKSSSSIIANTFKPMFSWMACTHNYSWFYCDGTKNFGRTIENAIIFWFRNFGIVFVFWLAAFFLMLYLFLRKKTKKIEGSFIVASFLLFFLPNVFLFQPRILDNDKIIFYWWFLAIIFGLLPFLQLIWQNRVYGKIAVTILIFLGIFAGLFDYGTRIMWAKNNASFRFSDSNLDSVLLANWIKENTSPNSLFLTAPSYDSAPSFLAGRKIYLGNLDLLWGLGLDYSKNDSNARKILSGDLEIACKEKIDYIFYNNDLIKNYYVNESIILENTEIIFSKNTTSNYNIILKIKCNKI